MSILHEVQPPGGDRNAVAVAWNINEAGDAVGQSSIYGPDGCPVSGDAYLWRADGTETVLEVAGGLPFSLAYDLNDLIAKQDGIDLVTATSINDRGEILAHGYLLAEPPAPCPDFVTDPATGTQVYDAARSCRSQHSFLLIPKHDDKDK